MELPDRAKLEQYIRKEHQTLDLPEGRSPSDSIFNYRVDDNGKCCLGTCVHEITILGEKLFNF